jgi:GR25 family glycosyltransferase involved in LPS biosynthesis
MIEIYIINLKKRKDRKALFLLHTATQLQEETLVWVEAVDGSTVPEQELIGFKWSSKNIEKKKRTYGCYKSHCKAIQQAIQSNRFPALILEDDAVLTETNKLDELFASAPENTTLLYFGALLCHHWALGGKKYTPTQEENKFEWVQLPEAISIFGGHAYGFKTKEAAEEVLEFLQGLPAAADYTLTQYRKYNPEKVRIFLPLQFIQRPGFSDIENKHMNRTV